MLYSSTQISFFFFSFRLELIPRRRGGVSHSDPLPPHVSSPGVIWLQVEKFQVLLNHVHISLLLPSSAAKSPRTSDFIILPMLVSPDRSTCPYHLSLASRILSVMHATPIFFRMFSFLCISFSEIPSIHLSILISVLSRSFSSFLLSVHASAPYIITGLIIVLLSTQIIFDNNHIWMRR